MNQIAFLGCPLDCDDQYDSIQEKCSSQCAPQTIADPYENVIRLIQDRLSSDQWTALGSIPVPDWLSPFPKGDMSALTSERFVQFIDNDGCRDYRTMVKGVVGQDILPNIPCMIAIDHSLTGGVIDAISDYYGRNNISLIVMDSHTDAIPMSVMAGAIHYDLETNPNSLYDPDDKLLYNRTDSYNASSFLDHILQEQLLDPSHVYLLGVSDFPPKKAFKIKDPRIQRYTSSFVDLKRKGLKIFTKEECIKFPSRISQALTKIKTPYVYLSIDMDIGAGNALEGVRFRNWKGLNQKQIEKLLMIFLAAIEPKQLVGMDLTEFNPRRAGQIIDGTHDGTYEIAATLIENIVRKIAL